MPDHLRRALRMLHTEAGLPLKAIAFGVGLDYHAVWRAVRGEFATPRRGSAKKRKSNR